MAYIKISTGSYVSPNMGIPRDCRNSTSIPIVTGMTQPSILLDFTERYLLQMQIEDHRKKQIYEV
jgi:hypothetical protein